MTQFTKFVRLELHRRGSWKDLASNVDEWRAWDRGWRCKLGWRAGLTFWNKTNVSGSRTLLARHWPHRLCWSWAIWVGRHRMGYDGARRFSLSITRQWRHAEIRLWLVYARLTWQDYDRMPGLRYKEDAPTIYWKHHLEQAEPAGSA